MSKPTRPGEPDWTILKILKWTAAYFESHHIDSPRTAAELLLAHALGLRRLDLYLRYDQPLNPAELERFKSLIRRRLEREPVAYITGRRGFWTLDLKVTPEVLIPRPETEVLVEAALERLPSAERAGPMRVLELGTGCGAVLLALAAERPGHVYFASDLAVGALGIARENARTLGLESNVSLFCSDWFQALQAGALRFDVIVANPPYIARENLDALEPEIARHEPRMALDGGTNGLRSLRHIIARAPLYLQRPGYLLLEMGSDQQAAVERCCKDCGAYAEPAFRKDYSGRQRVAELQTRVQSPPAPGAGGPQRLNASQKGVARF